MSSLQQRSERSMMFDTEQTRRPTNAATRFDQRAAYVTRFVGTDALCQREIGPEIRATAFRRVRQGRAPSRDEPTSASAQTCDCLCILCCFKQVVGALIGFEQFRFGEPVGVLFKQSQQRAPGILDRAGLFSQISSLAEFLLRCD